jgi:hypothetical protein
MGCMMIHFQEKMFMVPPLFFGLASVRHPFCEKREETAHMHANDPQH